MNPSATVGTTPSSAHNTRHSGHSRSEVLRTTTTRNLIATDTTATESSREPEPGNQNQGLDILCIYISPHIAGTSLCTD